MRKLVLKDKEAARKAAEENVRGLLCNLLWTQSRSSISQYLKNLVAEHIKEAKEAVQAKLAAAKAEILRAELAKEAKAAAANAAAKRAHDLMLLRAQLCGRIAHKKPLSREQCTFYLSLRASHVDSINVVNFIVGDAAIKLKQTEAERESRKQLEVSTLFNFFTSY